MIIAGLRFTVNSYKAVQGCKHIVKPGFVIRKPESDNGDSTMTNALAVQQGLMVPTGLSFFYEIKPPILEYKVQI